ncbi:GPP34 family phosphoprotein, partial [Pseudomonas sp. BGM005]|nr:GPP34 family phosphoprotein [Pseudomonas sp. BG5]
MLIVEELHMLLLRPDGRIESAVSVNRLYGEVAAVVVDLVLHGRVTVSNEKNPVVDIVSTEPTGNPILDTMLERLMPLR